MHAVGFEKQFYEQGNKVRQTLKSINKESIAHAFSKER